MWHREEVLLSRSVAGDVVDGLVQQWTRGRAEGEVIEVSLELRSLGHAGVGSAGRLGGGFEERRGDMRVVVQPKVDVRN